MKQTHSQWKLTWNGYAVMKDFSVSLISQAISKTVKYQKSMTKVSYNPKRLHLPIKVIITYLYCKVLKKHL